MRHNGRMPPVTTGRRTVTPETLFRVFALLETITWTMLIVAMLLKYVVESATGPCRSPTVHGLVFIAYALLAAVVAVNQRWKLGLAALAVASAVVPYATIPMERWLARHGHLEGGWRTEATDDPRDARPSTGCSAGPSSARSPSRRAARRPRRDHDHAADGGPSGRQVELRQAALRTVAMLRRTRGASGSPEPTTTTETIPLGPMAR